MLRSWLAIGFILATSRMALAAVTVYQERCRPRPEIARKLLHIAMGTLALPFPWLFDRIWPVLVLVGVFVGLLAAALIMEPLRYRIANVVYGVQRQSWGEFCFPLSMGILFVLSRNEPILYCVPLLLLTLADAVAAMVGMQYGQHCYHIAGSPKSIEGSAAFFIIALVVAQAALGSGPAAFGAAVIVAGCATFFEAAAPRGLDNLAVPLGSLGVLKICLWIAH